MKTFVCVRCKTHTIRRCCQGLNRITSVGVAAVINALASARMFTNAFHYCFEIIIFLFFFQKKNCFVEKHTQSNSLVDFSLLFLFCFVVLFHAATRPSLRTLDLQAAPIDQPTTRALARWLATR